MHEHNTDGSKTNFYNIAHCEDYDDFAEYLDLDGFEFNIGKSLFANLGNRHDATNPQREAKKCLHYAIRRAFKQLGRVEAQKMMLKYLPQPGKEHLKSFMEIRMEMNND